MLKTVLAIALVLAVKVLAIPLDGYVKQDTHPIYVQLEEPCVRQGGLCIPKNECVPDNIASNGIPLCPIQSSLGVVCCYA